MSTLEQPSTPTPPVHEVKASGPLGEIQAAWPRLLALIKTKHQRSIAAFLQEARATDLTDDTLTLSFTPKFTFHRDQLAANDRLAFVETCLAEVVGRAIRITLADAAPAAAGAPKEGAVEAGKRAAGRVSAAKEPGVRRAVEFFGGRVVEDGN